MHIGSADEQQLKSCLLKRPAAGQLPLACLTRLGQGLSCICVNIVLHADCAARSQEQTDMQRFVHTAPSNVCCSQGLRRGEGKLTPSDSQQLPQPSCPMAYCQSAPRPEPLPRCLPDSENLSCRTGILWAGRERLAAARAGAADTVVSFDHANGPTLTAQYLAFLAWFRHHAD